MMARILIFFTLLASFFLSSPSRAADSVDAALKDRVARHCQMWVAAPSHLARLPKAAMLPHLQQQTREYHALPDFSFVLPHYWPVLPWSLRVQVNQTLAAHVKSASRADEFAQACQLQSRILPITEAEEEAMAPGPAPQRLTAIVVTSLTPSISLTYQLSHDGLTGWQIDDIAVRQHSLVAQYHTRLHAVIRRQGPAGLATYLKQLEAPTP